MSKNFKSLLVVNNCPGNVVAHTLNEICNCISCLNGVYAKETNTVLVNVVNRHKEKAITGEVVNNSGDFTGKAGAN